MCDKSDRNVRVKTSNDVPSISIEPAAPAASDVPFHPARHRPWKRRPWPRASKGVLTNQSIMDMVEEGVPEAVIVSHIHASRTRFNLSTSEIIKLSKAKVPAAID